MSKRISIIIPVYNVEDYVEECLRSVTYQTKIDSLECIIVDDCGQDNSMSIVNDFVANYNGPIQFTIVHHDKNQGLSVARNSGIEVASGDYVYFLDSDDYIKMDCIASFLECLDNYPDAELVQAGADTINGNVFWLNLENRSSSIHVNDPKLIFQHLTDVMIAPITAWNKLVLRDLLIRNNLYFKPGIIHEDELWTYCLALNVRSYMLCAKNTYVYRIRDNSIMTTEKPKDISSWDTIIDEMITNINNEYKYLQIQKIINIICWLYDERLYSSYRNDLRLKIKLISRAYSWALYPRFMTWVITRKLTKCPSFDVL